MKINNCKDCEGLGYYTDVISTGNSSIGGQNIENEVSAISAGTTAGSSGGGTGGGTSGGGGY